MGLSIRMLMTIGCLSLFQARRLVRHPYPATATPLKRATRGRREVTFGFSELAPRLVDFGLSADVIAALAIASTSNTPEYQHE